ncbi:hypothetical protein PCCS19_24300 [Paenibacillus sp. CCS19]|nr:hypothetical protein PCCS19_24300 [Paenibacillus cellulosilyticus]
MGLRPLDPGCGVGSAIVQISYCLLGVACPVGHSFWLVREKCVFGKSVAEHG